MTASPVPKSLRCYRREMGERREREREREMGSVELGRGVANFKQGLACIVNFNHCMVCAQGL